MAAYPPEIFIGNTRIQGIEETMKADKADIAELRGLLIQFIVKESPPLNAICNGSMFWHRNGGEDPPLILPQLLLG